MIVTYRRRVYATDDCWFQTNKQIIAEQCRRIDGDSVWRVCVCVLYSNDNAFVMKANLHAGAAGMGTGLREIYIGPHRLMFTLT